MQNSTKMEQILFNYMNQEQAIKFLKRVILVEKKDHLVKDDIHATHEIIKFWAQMNYVDDYAHKIVSMLNKTTDLNSIANKIGDQV